MSDDSARVLIGGDICPTPGDIDLFLAGKSSELFGDLLPEFASADLTLVNLECPLIDAPSPIAKSGAHFGVPRGCINGLKKAGIDVISLANNHIMDHGRAGLESTLSACKDAGLSTVGAGPNLEAARRMHVTKRKGVRLGILSCAEHEFSIATTSKAGANPIDPIEFTRILSRESGNFDHLIVLLHAGKEHTPYPPPKLQNLARFMIEQGASAIICQHSHYSGVYEHYRNGFISYGQGNFLFNPYPDARHWLYEGYLIAMNLDVQSLPVVEIIPHAQLGVKPGVRRMDNVSAKKFRTTLARVSEEIADPTFLEQQWLEQCLKNRQLYLSILRGQGRILRNINKHIPINNLHYSRQQSLVLYDVIHCESKHEELATILDHMIGDYQDR